MSSFFNNRTKLSKNLLAKLDKKQPIAKNHAFYLRDILHPYLLDIKIHPYFIELTAKDCISMLFVLEFLKKNTLCQYKQLTDIICVDYPNRKQRFEINYQLLSLVYNTRLCLTLNVQELQKVPSVTSLYNAADWMEREVWDLYGVFFEGHPDLRRILTDYGFEGHPLRKDFPLTGFLEIFYDDSKKRIVYEKVSLAQEYRNFNFLNPWSLGKYK